MSNELHSALVPVLTAVGAGLVLLVKAIFDKIAARVKNIPDAVARRQANADEHAKELEVLTEILENQKEIHDLRKRNEELLKKVAQIEAKNDKLVDAIHRTGGKIPS